MTGGTRCPICDFFNHEDANVNAQEAGPVYCNCCHQLYYPASTPAQARESARVVWNRDWDAVAFGFVIGGTMALACQAMGLATWVSAAIVAGILVGWIGLALRMTKELVE